MTLQEWLDDENDVDFNIYKDLNIYVKYLCEGNHCSSVKEAKSMALKEYKQIYQNQLDILNDIQF